MTATRAAFPALLLTIALPCCGARAALDTGAGEPGSSDAGPEAPPQCICPQAPGYVTCVLPMECCPVVGVCKNPATWDCTGSMKPCP